MAKRVARDPRFDAAIAGTVDQTKLRKAYAFLDDYREDEMKELREGIRKEKDETKRDTMKRALLAMESRKKTQARKDAQAEVLSKHRREEKELVRQGKQPYYLKKPELQKKLLMDQYSQLSGKRLDRVIERRRKKVESKEKKQLPRARRVLDS